LYYWLIPILFVSLCPLAVAQESATQEKQENKAEHKSVHTVTGCLQKGDEADEFAITGEDGKTWGLRSSSSSVKLDDHLGHKVTVTGSATHESKAEEKKEGEVEKASSKEEYGDLDVTSLKMVSDTCSK
jgi:hypothetical protein